MLRINKCLIILMLTLLSSFSLTANAGTLDQLLRQSGDPVVGNRNAKVTIVEFFDYQCPHCTNMAPVLTNILKNNSDVRIVYKEYPILGPLSDFIARAALAANMQGKYAAFNHALLTSSRFLTQDAVLEIAKGIELDVNKLKKDMNSSTVTSQLNKNLALAGLLNVMSTPAFFIGPTNAQSKDKVEYVLGEMNQNELQTAVDRAAK